MATRTKIHFDGGARPNPGPIETAIFVHGGSLIRTGLGIGTNGEAEWLALIHAAEFAIAQHLDEIVFIGDSLQVIQQAKDIGKCRSPELRELQARFRALAAQLNYVGLRHVPRSKNLAGIALQRRHGGLDPA
ncbi:reverse transcriptase-like protein [Sphingomonas sp. MMS24-J13]|uniref:reverse transcriptase-like protein n=1 Tax=Sphingomonas sp. MMS24-J13 TaxID=3238686 RepID=UPI00384C6134